VALDPWVWQGILEVTPDEVVEYNFILACLARLKNDNDTQEVAFDRWGAAKLRADIENIGFTLMQFGQGFGSMSAPMKELERLIINKRIRHGDHPILSWMADNVVARVDPAGNIKLDKDKSTEKIDGIVVLIMGLDRAIRWRDTQSVYETRDVRVITF